MIFFLIVFSDQLAVINFTTEMAFFLCVTDSLLRHRWTDLHETLRVNRSHPKLVQRHIFDFRFRPETGKEPIFLKTGSSNNQNRKSKSISSESSRVFVMRVLSSFFDISILEAIRIIFVRVCPYTHTQRAKIFKSFQRLPCSKYRRTKIVLMTQNLFLFRSGIFLTSGSEILNFRFMKKQLTSGSRLETEVGNMTLHQFRVRPIHSQSFMQIGPLVSE